MDIWDRYENIRQSDALHHRTPPGPPAGESHTPLPRSGLKIPMPPCKHPAQELSGELWITGPGHHKGLFLKDSNGKLIDVELPACFQGKRVKITVALDG